MRREIASVGRRARSSSRLAAAVALAAVLAIVAAPAPAQEPVLTVSGAAGGPVELTIERLRELGGTEFTTSTPWTEGVSTFAGVTGRQLVEALGVSGTEVVADAVNDYQVVIPFEVFDSDTLMVAYARDGEAMPVRDKGPLWVVFPFDSDEIYRSDTYRAYSIWSLTRLEFR